MKLLLLKLPTLRIFSNLFLNILNLDVQKLSSVGTNMNECFTIVLYVSEHTIFNQCQYTWMMKFKLHTHASQHEDDDTILTTHLKYCNYCLCVPISGGVCSKSTLFIILNFNKGLFLNIFI